MMSIRLDSRYHRRLWECWVLQAKEAASIGQLPKMPTLVAYGCLGAGELERNPETRIGPDAAHITQNR
jgi:hypothetical protein